MRIAPCTITEAREVVSDLHRHLPKPPKSGRFALAVLDDADTIHGVALVGHGARMSHNRWLATITRVATDGTPNACSMLYGACARVWGAMGGRVLHTFTLESELGSSLKAAGYVWDGVTEGGEWSRRSRRREAAQEAGPKNRWVKTI